MTNQAIIVFRWGYQESGRAKALCRSSGVLIDCMDGITDVDVTVNKKPNEEYDVEMTAYVDITQSYSVPKDCASKAAILADTCQRLRGAIYTEAMNYRNGDIREGMIADMFVYRWDTDNWELYDEEDREDDIHE